MKEKESSTQKKLQSTISNIVPSIDEVEQRYLELVRIASEDIKCIQHAREIFETLPAEEKLAMFLYDNESFPRVEFANNLKDRWWYPFYEYAQNRVKSDLRDNNPWLAGGYQNYLERAKRILEYTDVETVINIYEDIHPANKRRDAQF